MKRIRRIHQASFKAKIAIEALKEQKTLSQISEEHSLHPNQISDWKKMLIERSVSIFEKMTTADVIDLDLVCAPYLEQIGTLQMEINFLKKKLKHLGQV